MGSAWAAPCPCRASPLTCSAEARHTATSWEYGTGFFRDCTDGEKHHIRGLLADRLSEMFDRHFSDRAQNEANGNTRCATHGLNKALRHPAYAGFPATIEQLKASWRDKSYECGRSDSYKKSLKWFAKQWMRFVDKFEIRPNRADSAWQRLCQTAS